MTLAAGTRLGPYEVLGPLGAGGMGEVYRARDQRLSRSVALKVLPGEISADKSRLERFEKEARAASSLNHPNIVTIYDIGSSESVAYIAMELVEGRTLREMLVSGPIALRRLLSLSAQVADGLAKAHAAGIVHRDLKPENLMVTRDGFVKILDFGLAKLVPSGFEASDGSHLPTVTRGTEPGTEALLPGPAHRDRSAPGGKAHPSRRDQGLRLRDPAPLARRLRSAKPPAARCARLSSTWRHRQQPLGDGGNVTKIPCEMKKAGKSRSLHRSNP